MHFSINPIELSVSTGPRRRTRPGTKQFTLPDMVAQTYDPTLRRYVGGNYKFEATLDYTVNLQGQPGQELKKRRNKIV